MGKGTSIRILMVVPYFPPPYRGGMEKQAHLLAGALVEDGHKVTVLARKFLEGQMNRCNDHGVDVLRLNFGIRILDGLYMLLIPFFIFSKRHEYDIIHVHTIKPAGLLAIFSAKLSGKKTLIKIPSNSNSGIAALECGPLAGLRKWTLRLADSVIALSDECRGQLERLGCPSGKIFRASNGVDADKFPAVERRQCDICRVVFLGRLITRKGLKDLLDAWQILKRCCADQPHRLSIYGDGPIAPQIRKAIRCSSLEDSVILHGHTDNVEMVLQNADILVLPSYGEGNSNAILEAMVNGIPIASTRLGGTMNLVGREGWDFLHEPGDVTGLSEILMKLCCDSSLRLEIGKKMKERALRFFSIGHVKDKYVDAYRIIMDGNMEQISDCSTFPPD